MLQLKPEGVVEALRKVVRTVRYDPLERTLVTFGLLLLALPKALLAVLPELPEILKQVLAWIPLTGLLLWARAAWLIWKKAIAPVPEGKPKPPAIKGPAPFDPNDAELFARLGRKDDLDRLRAWILDDQKPLVALMGESGVGKTSLLRAGLGNHLKGDAVQVIYWEALPTEPEEGLLHAVQSRWEDSTTAPTTFARLASMVATGKRVVVIDQAEQLSPERHRTIFEMLRRVATASPPYAATWVVAFRREYMSAWRDFELTLPEPAQRRLETLSLRRFLPEQAERVISILAEEGALPIEQKVVKALVESIEFEGRITPADIGISLLVLSEISGNGKESAFTVDDFRERGGQAGLLMRYLERLLEQFPEAERRELLQGLLLLMNLDNDQRLAEGRTPLELEKLVRPTNPPRFAAVLRFLASGKARVLEEVPEPPLRYRLIHERLIPAIRRLAGGLLVDADQAGDHLQRAYRVWSRDRKTRYLLSGRELRQALTFREQLFWGDEENRKREYLQLSRQHRNRLWLSAAIVLIALSSGIYLFSEHRSQVAANQALLISWRLPPDLLDHLYKLEELTLPEGVTRVDWLGRANRLRSLRIESSELTNLGGLPESLRELSIQSMLDTSKLLDLPKNLASLEIHADDLESLKALPKNLSRLDLYLHTRETESKVIDLSHLERLKTVKLALSPPERYPIRLGKLILPSQVSSVSLERVHPKSSNLPSKLEHLTCLNCSEIGLPKELKHLHLRFPDEINITAPPLQTLSLDLLRFFRLKPLPSVPHLRLYIPNHYYAKDGPITLDQFPPNLKSLQLYSSNSRGVRVELKNLPQGLEQLEIAEALSANLSSGLPAGLKTLAVGEKHTGLHTIPDGLTSLTYSGIAMPPLPKSIRSLTVNVKHYEPLKLAKLHGIKRLELHGKIKEIPGFLRSLEYLDISRTEIQALQGLPPNLISLTLESGQVNTLKGLPESVVCLKFRERTSDFF